MKRVCLLFLAIVLLTYGYQGYKVVALYKNDVLTIKTSGKLSDITENVLSVPLEMPDTGAVRNIRKVRKDGDHLFMISDNRLLHFDIQGKYINQIANELHEDNDTLIVEYLLNTTRHQALVVDSQRYISTFDYDGNLISKIRINHPWHKVTAMAFHNESLWVTAQTLVKQYDNPTACQIKHNLYQLDMQLNEVSCHPLHTVNTGRKTLLEQSFVDELLADEQGVYAYTTNVDDKYLLDDTLHIALQKKIPLLYKDAHFGMACIYPVRKGKRFYISTNNNKYADHGFTFCFDDKKQTAYMLADGFKDDFFKTGYIPDLQPMDMYNDSYYFLKSGKEIARKFPARAKNYDAPVLFILKLNV